MELQEHMCEIGSTMEKEQIHVMYIDSKLEKVHYVVFEKGSNFNIYIKKFIVACINNRINDMV